MPGRSSPITSAAIASDACAGHAARSIGFEFRDFQAVRGGRAIMLRYEPRALDAELNA